LSCQKKLKNLTDTQIFYHVFNLFIQDRDNIVSWSKNDDFNISYYTNSSYISGPFPEDSQLFIATQGPLKNTIENFWNMVMNKQVKLIIMLTNLQEHGRKKCELYWPEENPIVFEKFSVTSENEFYLLDKSVIQKNFILFDEETKKSENITQLHAVCWPDHSIPEDETGYKAIELLLSYIDDYRNFFPESPIIVHCR
jgi:protein-tyrosine phosphatase